MTVLLSSPAASQVPGLSGTLIVTNKGPATATIVDVASGRTLATLPTGNGPHEVALSPSGRVAVVTDYGAQVPGSTLTVIDMLTLRVVRTIELGEYRRPHGIKFLAGDSLVAVTSEVSRNVVIVNVAEGVVRKAIPTQHNGSHMLGIVADGSRIYTGDIGSNTVSELDVKSGTYVRSWDVPAQAEAVNVTPDGKEVWVGSNATGKVSVVNPATGEVKTAAEGFGFPYPDLKAVLLPDARKNELRFVDRATHKELGRLSLSGGPQGIALSPDDKYAFQSLSQQGRVAIIDVSARRVAGHVQVGDTPDGIAYTTRIIAR